MLLTTALDRFPWLKTAREVALFAYRRGKEVRLQQVAASLSFTTLLSIVPLFAVALSIFAAFPLFADSRDALQSLMSKTLPPQISTTVIGYISEFASQAARLTAAGLIVLALSALAMIMTVDHVLNDIWQVRNRRSFGQRLLIYWALLTVGPLLIGASLTASSFVWSPSEAELRRIPWILRGLLDYAPVILSGFAYSALYVFVPNRLVRWRDALLGGFVAAILAELLKVGYAFFIARGSVRSIYGAFAAMPLFLLWMYLSWYVLLFGAAIAATLPRLRSTRFSDELRAGNAFVTALALLRHLLDARRDGVAGVGSFELAQRARTDLVDAERLLETLERLGYVRRVAMPRRRGESSEWLMSADPARVTLRPAFERFAIDPSNLLLALDRQGLGPLLTGWLDNDSWINAPLEQSLPMVSVAAAAAPSASSTDGGVVHVVTPITNAAAPSTSTPARRSVQRE
jgi:membrane protein